MRQVMIVVLFLMIADGVSADDAIPNFVMDLRNRSANTVLPFDEAFNVRAHVDENVIGGTLTIFAKDGARCSTTPVAGATKLPGVVVKEKVNNTDITALLFSAPELGANKIYCFEFTVKSRLTDNGAVTARFRRLLSDELERSLRTSDVSGVPAGHLQGLRDKVREVAKNLSSAQNLVLDTPANSPFAANASDRTVQLAFEQLLLPVFHHQMNRTVAINSYCRNRPRLIEELEKVQKNDSKVQMVLRALDAQRLTNGSIATLLASNEPGFDRLLFTGMGDENLGDLLRRDDDCNHAAKTPKTLGGAWTPVAVQAPIEQTESLARDIAAVLSMVRALRNDNLKLAKIANINNATTIDAAEAELDALRKTALGVNGIIERAKSALDQRAVALDALSEKVVVVGEQDISVATSSTPEFAARAKYYFSADVGVASAFNIDETFTYAGVNLYLRPVNKRVPMPLLGGNHLSRISFMIGVSVTDVKKDGAHEGVLAKKALLGAVGYRVFESVKVSGGYAAVKVADPNPLVTDSNVELEPFVAISIDWDVRDALGKLGSLLSFNQ